MTDFYKKLKPRDRGIIKRLAMDRHDPTLRSVVLSKLNQLPDVDVEEKMKRLLLFASKWAKEHPKLIEAEILIESKKTYESHGIYQYVNPFKEAMK